MSTSYQPHKKRKLNNTRSVFNIKQFEIHEAAEGEIEDEYDNEIESDIDDNMLEDLKQQSETSYKKRQYKEINPLISKHNNTSYNSINYMLEQMKQPIYNQNNSNTNNTNHQKTQPQKQSIPIKPRSISAPPNNRISIKPVLPSIKDANLWLLPCKKGREEFSVQKLLDNKDKYEYNPQKKLFIYNAFIIDIKNGYIYVEADKKCHVQSACRDIQYLKANKIKLVPLDERMCVFKMRDSMQNMNSCNNDNDLYDICSFKPLIKATNTFFAGEKVRVISGSFINLIGIISCVKDKNNIIIQPNDIRLSDQILNSKELIKLIDIGSFVRVINGKYKNITGNVIEIYFENNKVLINNKIQSKNIIVNINNITQIEQTKIYDFNLYDFVYFGVSKYGIIVNIKYNELQILNIKGQIYYCHMNDIIKKCMKNMVGFDINNNKICIGDIIRPQIGNFKNKNVIVKHIYNNVLFCHSKICYINGGIFVIKASYCCICGGKSNEINSFNYKSKNKWKRNKWISKQVKITHGFYKGMIGIVCSVNDKTLHIELNCKNKKVKIGYNYVKVVNKNENIKRETYDKRYIECNTPAYNISSTPIYENDNDNVWNPNYF